MPYDKAECPAEELLVEEGFALRRSAQRRAIIGCIGCQWLRAEELGEEPRLYGLKIAQCTNIKTGVVYPLLRKFAEMGVVVKEKEDISESKKEERRSRFYYYPVDSDLGEAFHRKLEAPEVCSLEVDT